MSRSDGTQFKYRLPADIVAWVDEQVRRNGSSRNSEMIRALRERMDREAASKAAGEK